MGCSNSKSTTAIDDAKPNLKPNKMAASPNQEYPASEAFTIPLDDAGVAELPLNETLRQPPKRLQQLMQQAAETEPLTLEELEEKQQRAEQRRQELLQQKLETIQKNTQILLRGQADEGEPGPEAEEQPEESTQN